MNILCLCIINLSVDYEIFFYLYSTFKQHKLTQSALETATWKAERLLIFMESKSNVVQWSLKGFQNLADCIYIVSDQNQKFAVEH